MQDYSLLTKEDFKDIAQLKAFENQQKTIKRKAIVIRFGILFVVCLIVVLIGIIIALLSKNKQITNKSNNLKPSSYQHSNILNEESLSLIKQWIPNLNKENNKLSLLFKATRDGCHPESFINHVVDNNPTVIVAASQEGNIFGGYTESSWDNTKEDSNAFLFSISNQEKYPVINKKKAIEWNTNLVFKFGSTDFIIVDDCLNKPSGTSIGSGTYKMANSLNPSHEIGFYIKEIEVFTLEEEK